VRVAGESAPNVKEAQLETNFLRLLEDFVGVACRVNERSGVTAATPNVETDTDEVQF